MTDWSHVATVVEGLEEAIDQFSQLLDYPEGEFSERLAHVLNRFTLKERRGS